MGYFKDKTAIVTGAASGIGRAVAESLSASGATVIIADLSGEGARQVADGIANKGGRAEAVVLDVTSAEDIQRLVDETVVRYEQLDYLFNNAGIGIAGEVRDLSVEDWRRIVDVNLMGVIYGTSAAYRVMVKQGSGHIVNTASLAGLLPGPMMAPYTATKHAVVGLSKSLRIEAENFGVKVSVICPGFVQTGIFDNGIYRGLSKEAMVSRVPFKMMDSTQAARIILRGIQKNRALIVFPFYARLFWLLHRLHPKLTAPLERKTFKDFGVARDQ